MIKNTFINFIKKFLIEKKIRSRIKALERIKALLLPILDLSIKS